MEGVGLSRRVRMCGLELEVAVRDGDLRSSVRTPVSKLDPKKLAQFDEKKPHILWYILLNILATATSYVQKLLMRQIGAFFN